MVVGSNGMLGTDLCSALDSLGIPWIGVDLPEVNITDCVSILTAVERVKPELIINTAALTDVDGCENHQQMAYRVNALGASHVAKAVRSCEAFLIHLSTDYVFDGTKTTPYMENDPVNPLGIYGRTKAEGEELVMSVIPDASLIVRTQWLYGIHGKNFVEAILKACQERDVLRVVSDQYGRPTFTKDLVEALVKLVELRPKGICHVANSGQTTWHGFASAIVEMAGLNHIRVEEMTTVELNRPAPRPLNSVLDVGRFESLTGRSLRNWQEGLKAYLKDTKRFKG